MPHKNEGMASDVTPPKPATAARHQPVVRLRADLQWIEREVPPGVARMVDVFVPQTCRTFLPSFEQLTLLEALRQGTTRPPYDDAARQF
jgi:hypothetical protein